MVEQLANVGVVDDLLSVIRDRSTSWFKSERETTVELQRVENRSQSTLVHVRVTTAGRPRSLIAKMPKIPIPALAPNLRLVEPVADPVVKSRLEYEALVATAAHFRALDNPRFGWVNAYDHLPEFAAVVVGVVEEPTLDRLLRGATDRSFNRRDQERAIENVGAWMSHYGQVVMPDAEPRDQTAVEFLAGCDRLIEALARSDRGRRLPPDFREVLGDVAPRLFEAPARTGLGHGDLAPRNIFVGEQGQVTIIDSLARFLVPAEEDMAYFLVELATGSTRFARWHRPRSSVELARYRRRVLDGYGLVDSPRLALFEVRSTLDKWRSLAERANGPGHRATMTTAVRERIAEYRIRSLTRSLASPHRKDR